MKNAVKGFEAMAQRTINAQDSFIQNVMDQFGKTKEESLKVLKMFIKAKAVKLDAIHGKYNLTHGMYWNAQVIENAINL